MPANFLKETNEFDITKQKLYNPKPLRELSRKK